MITSSTKNKHKRQAAKWLLGLIGEDWGIRVLPADADSPRPVHANTNRRFEAILSQNLTKQAAPTAGLAKIFDSWCAEAQHDESSSRIWLQRLSQRQIVRHFDGVPQRFVIDGKITSKPETIYFTAKRTKPRQSCHTLLMIDIDAHKRGGPKEAMEFADFLRDSYFPDLYVESSTNGNGAHAYLIIDKNNWADSDYNALLREFDAWLKAVLTHTGIDLDCVEIKGSCATVSWTRNVPKHAMGMLAKLPRDWERFDELKNSPKYTGHELLKLMKANPIRTAAAAKIQKMRQAGSLPCTGIDPERLEGWLNVAKALLPGEVRVGNNQNNRLMVTSEDVGITLALLEFIGRHMNADGTLPWRRMKGLWDCLYSREVVRRSFNSKRFAWIRRMLSGAGLVDIHDPTYIIGKRAAKWCPSQEFWTMASLINTEREEEQYFAETITPIDALQCWEKGVPLVAEGIETSESTERGRIDELILEIIGTSHWEMAA